MIEIQTDIEQVLLAGRERFLQTRVTNSFLKLGDCLSTMSPSSFLEPDTSIFVTEIRSNGHSIRGGEYFRRWSFAERFIRAVG